MIRTFIVLQIALIRMVATAQTTAPSVQEQVQAELAEFNTAMMERTFFVSGPAVGQASGLSTTGTVFLIGKPLKTRSALSRPVLVTAAHVLKGIAGDTATVQSRVRDSSGRYTAVPVQIKIRDQGSDLYLVHPNADVAVMYVDTPILRTGRVSLGPDFLASDQYMEKVQFHAGDELFVLGYPLSFQGSGGFPILRAARISSYPVFPASIAPQVYIDLVVFPGNSGGPVYFVYCPRVNKGVTDYNQCYKGIFGLVSRQARVRQESLFIAEVIPSQFILKAVQMLKDPD